MLKYNDLNVTITCDKCGVSQTSTSEDYNGEFYNSGWGMSMNSKYTHRCAKCLVKAGFKLYKKYLPSTQDQGDTK